MLTRDEKEMLEALKEHMDDEQKEALSEMSEEDIKELLQEAKKEMEKHMSGKRGMPKGCLPKIRDLRDCPWGEIWRTEGRWSDDQSRLSMSLVKLLLKVLFFWL